MAEGSRLGTRSGHRHPHSSDDTDVWYACAHGLPWTWVLESKCLWSDSSSGLT